MIAAGLTRDNAVSAVSHMEPFDGIPNIAARLAAS
jgi:hypothetical protein